MNKYHKTKNGHIMLIKDMSNNHLMNTIEMIKRMAKKGITIENGSLGLCHDDFDYDIEELTGKEAKKHLNYYAYKEEMKKRLNQKEVNHV